MEAGSSYLVGPVSRNGAGDRLLREAPRAQVAGRPRSCPAPAHDPLRPLGLRPERCERIVDDLALDPVGLEPVADEGITRPPCGEGARTPLGEAAVVEEPRALERRERSVAVLVRESARDEACPEHAGAQISVPERPQRCVESG